MTTKTFKEEFSVEKRKADAERILAKHPDRIPVIVERSQKAEPDVPFIDKKKFLVPDLTVGQFVYVIRKRMTLRPEKALYLHFNNKLYSTSDLMRNVYEAEKDPECSFLFCTYTGENTFGSCD